jgi:hypothetical protein
MNRKLVAACLVALVVGYWLAGQCEATPHRDRPVARWVAGVAKRLLWVALIAEDPPADPQPDHQVVRSQLVGDDGYPLVNHARGW